MKKSKSTATTTTSNKRREEDPNSLISLLIIICGGLALLSFCILAAALATPWATQTLITSSSSSLKESSSSSSATTAMTTTTTSHYYYLYQTCTSSSSSNTPNLVVCESFRSLQCLEADKTRNMAFLSAAIGIFTNLFLALACLFCFLTRNQKNNSSWINVPNDMEEKERKTLTTTSLRSTRSATRFYKLFFFYTLVQLLNTVWSCGLGYLVFDLWNGNPCGENVPSFRTVFLDGKNNGNGNNKNKNTSQVGPSVILVMINVSSVFVGLIIACIICAVEKRMRWRRSLEQEEDEGGTSLEEKQVKKK